MLKIDVEGYEMEAISGGDWVRWRPRVVLVENNGAERWEPLLLGRGYLHAVTTEINRYYVREEDRSLLPQFLRPLGPQDSFILEGELNALGVDSSAIYGETERAECQARVTTLQGQLEATQRQLRPYRLVDRLGLVTVGYGWARKLKHRLLS